MSHRRSASSKGESRDGTWLRVMPPPFYSYSGTPVPPTHAIRHTCCLLSLVSRTHSITNLRTYVYYWSFPRLRADICTYGTRQGSDSDFTSLIYYLSVKIHVHVWKGVALFFAVCIDNAFRWLWNRKKLVWPVLYEGNAVDSYLNVPPNRMFRAVETTRKSLYSMKQCKAPRRDIGT